MSITIKILKIISILSFLLIPGLDQNGIPNFALLTFYIFQFFNDLFNNSSANIFWDGLITIPIVVGLFVFYKWSNYKILFFCFIGLLISLTYVVGLFINYTRINFWFVFMYTTYVASSITVVLLTRRP